jgi:preprotein translocase subunit YajC
MIRETTMAAIRAWKNFPSTIPWIMLVILAAVNVLLIRQNLQMRAKLNRSKPEVLQTGDKVQSISVRGLHDEIISLDSAGDTKRVLLYFTPT